MKSALQIFTELGERLSTFGTEPFSLDVIERAVAANSWFTSDGICRAVEALRVDMLQYDKLREWLSAYELRRENPRRVAIIMAGNIPLVGFFDLMCVVASGHKAIVKPSSKDRVLVDYVIGLLRDIEPCIPIERSDVLSGDIAAEAVIAMGGDNTRRSLKSIYAGCPQLLRGNRHSVAVLSGHETPEELAALADDIFSYSGLGCRNVSMIFMPRNYVLRLPSVKTNPKYGNNYRQSRALLTMTGGHFNDTGCCLLVESREFPSSLSCVATVEYDDLSEVAEWLHEHDYELQCVVSECLQHSRRVAFGRSQHPSLTDYPDDVDVMAFLAGI